MNKQQIRTEVRKLAQLGLIVPVVRPDGLVGWMPVAPGTCWACGGEGQLYIDTDWAENCEACGGTGNEGGV